MSAVCAQELPRYRKGVCLSTYMKFLAFPFQRYVDNYLPPHFCEAVEVYRYLHGNSPSLVYLGIVHRG